MATPPSSSVEVVVTRQEGSSWGLNVGRRGKKGAFVVTSVLEGSAAASHCFVLSRKNVRFEIMSGDEIVSIGGRVLDATTTQGEMRQLFVGSGNQVVLVLSRPGLEPQVGLRRWASKARRSMSVDVRAMTKTWFTPAQPTPIAAAPSEAVKLSSRIFVAAGGAMVDCDVLSASLEAQLETHPSSDDMLDEKLSRVLFLNVGERADFPRSLKGRVLDLGWQAPLGSSTPTLDFAARLGLAACAWLDLDKRTAIVVCDASRGDRARLGLATAVVLRVASSVLGEVSADASVEAYDAYVKAIGGPHNLSIDKLPPSVSRSLRHVDFAVEARRLPNDKPLALLGVSVRGLPLSDAPVLKVSTSPNTFLWSSEQSATTADNVVDWDGDEAFYAVEGCVVKGDFCVVVRFGGAYGAQFTQDESSATIIRYVASTAFLSDGAIDARSTDVDIHPAYSEQLGKEDDFRIRFAFRYVEDQPAAETYFLPFDRDEAVYQGLTVIAEEHAVREPDQTKLAQLPVTDPLIARLALQLGNNDLDAAFRTTAHLPRLEDLSILAQQRAAKREQDVVLRQQLPQAQVATAPAPGADDAEDDDELDAKEVVVKQDAPPKPVVAAPPPLKQRTFGKGRRGKRRTESLPPQKIVESLPSRDDAKDDDDAFVFVGHENAQVFDQVPPPTRRGDNAALAPVRAAHSVQHTIAQAAKVAATPQPSVVSATKVSGEGPPQQPLLKTTPTLSQQIPAGSLDSASVVVTPGDEVVRRPSSPNAALEAKLTAQSGAATEPRSRTLASDENEKESKAAALEAGLAAKFGNAAKKPEPSPHAVEDAIKPASAAAALESGLAAKFGATRPAPSTPGEKKEEAPASAAAALEAGLAAKFGASASPSVAKEEATKPTTAAAALEAGLAASRSANKLVSEEDTSASSGLPLGEHPAMKQWAKLLKVGLPKGAVAKKMTEEGVNPALLEMDLQKPPTPEAMAMLRGESDAAAGGGQSLPATKREWGKSKKATIGKRQSLKPVHWEPLAGGATEGTVWAASESRSVDESERAELKRLFAVKPTSASLPTAKKAAVSQFAGVEACDGKRAANVAIGLQALSKKFDGDLSKVARAARDLDAEALSLENVAQLTPLLPSDSEDTETRRIFFSTEKEPKRLAESFFVAVARVVDEKDNGVETVGDLRTRLGILSDYLSADEASRKLETDSLAIETAATAARESLALAEAFQRLLTLGNALNEGTHRGGAAGFTLASLQRLATTKSADSGESVLDFAARKPLAADDANLQALAGPLKVARKHSLKELRTDLDRLNDTAKALANLPGSASRSKAEDCAAKAGRGRVALENAAEQAATTAKFFGEEPTTELSELFGTLAKFVDDFSQARSKAAAQQQRDIATAASATTPTPKSASQRRETRTKARSRHGLSVDEMLKTTSPKVRRQ